MVETMTQDLWGAKQVTAQYGALETEGGREVWQEVTEGGTTKCERGRGGRGRSRRSRRRRQWHKLELHDTEIASLCKVSCPVKCSAQSRN